MADLPAKQAQYVAYAEKDSKARNIAAKIDELESKAVTTEHIRLASEDVLAIMQALAAGNGFDLYFNDIPDEDRLVYELRNENPDVDIDLIMYKTGITRGEQDMPAYVGKAMFQTKMYSFYGDVILNGETLQFRVVGYVDMPVIANTSDVPTAALTNIDVGGVLYSVGGSGLYLHNIKVLADYNGISNVAFWIQLYMNTNTKFADVGELADYLYSHGADSYHKHFALASSELTSMVKDGKLRTIGICYPFASSNNTTLNISVNYSETSFATDGSSITITNSSRGSDYITTPIARATSLGTYYIMSV